MTIPEMSRQIEELCERLEDELEFEEFFFIDPPQYLVDADGEPEVVSISYSLPSEYCLDHKQFEAADFPETLREIEAYIRELYKVMSDHGDDLD